MSTVEEQDERTTLARARAGLSPSAADAARVRASLAAALAAPGNMPPDASPAPPTSGAGAAGWSLRVLVTSVAVATVGAGAGGYWLGHRAAAREARMATVETGLNQPLSPSPPEAATAAAPPSSVPDPSPSVGALPGVKETTHRRAGTAARATRPPATTSAAESLGQEVQALRAVERALRDDRPRLALAILQQLDRDVPQGKLVEERRATSVIARCAAGDVPFGVNWAEDFASDYPDSVYRGRVEQSCERTAGGK